MPRGITICPAATPTRPAPVTARVPGARAAAIRTPRTSRATSCVPGGSTARPLDALMCRVSACIDSPPRKLVDGPNTYCEMLDLDRAVRGQAHFEPGIEVDR